MSRYLQRLGTSMFFCSICFEPDYCNILVIISESIKLNSPSIMIWCLDDTVFESMQTARAVKSASSAVRHALTFG